MAHTIASRHIDDIVGELAARAVSRDGVPQAVADYAAAATAAALRTAATRGLKRRARSYFDVVVRRRLVSRHGGTPAAARVVVDAVVADLMDSGRAPQDVWDELARGWGDKLPGEVMEEYRQVLCA